MLLSSDGGTGRHVPNKVRDTVKRLHLAKEARMVELVDTQDLKSCALNRRAGSIPAPSTLLGLLKTDGGTGRHVPN